MNPIKVAVIGAGNRGTYLSNCVMSDPRARIVAVAERRDAYRAQMAQRAGLSVPAQFNDWQAMFAAGVDLDAVIVSTQDREHVKPAIAAFDRDLHVLLEKPMATSLEDCRKIEAAQRRSGKIGCVCHSLRYHKGFSTVVELVRAGAVGRVISVNLLEQVGWAHQAHSYVRGKWAKQDEATFMLMAKSCHDVDYLCHLIGLPCRQVSSFGALTFFRPEYAPAGSGERCTSCGIERECEYSAIKHYVDADREHWPADVVSADHSRESHLRAVETGPYGRCVWKCGNDVVDHQTVNFLFDQDITATFTMTAFTQGGGRRLRIHGTKAQLTFDEKQIQISNFATGDTQTTSLGQEVGHHGGGDARMVRDWISAMVENAVGGVSSSIQASLASHTLAFAAEHARLTNTVVDIEAFFEAVFEAMKNTADLRELA